MWGLPLQGQTWTRGLELTLPGGPTLWLLRKGDRFPRASAEGPQSAARSGDRKVHVLSEPGPPGSGSDWVARAVLGVIGCARLTRPTRKGPSLLADLSPPYRPSGGHREVSAFLARPAFQSPEPAGGDSIPQQGGEEPQPQGGRLGPVSHRGGCGLAAPGHRCRTRSLPLRVGGWALGQLLGPSPPLPLPG